MMDVSAFASSPACRIVLAFGVFTLACTDPRGSFDDFLARSEDQRIPPEPPPDLGGGGGTTSGGTESGPSVDLGGSSPDLGGSGTPPDLGPPLPDVSGTFLLGLAAVIAPEYPLQFIATAELTPDGASGGTLTLTVQPLALEQYSTDTPRTPTGDPFTSDPIDVAPGGAFGTAFTDVTVPGAANPISGSELTATFVLDARIVDADGFCGAVSGTATVGPIDVNLNGSTFGAVRITESTPDTLPTTIPVSCATVPGGE